jgi:hypothetical protein
VVVVASKPADTKADANAPQRGQPAPQEILVGLLAAPAMADMAAQLAQDLPEKLAERLPGVRFTTDVAVEPLASAAGFREDLVQLARRRMLEERWTVAVCLTDLPLRVGRRPVTAHLSVTLGVLLVSVPALGAIATTIRARETVLRLLDDLLTERLHRPRPEGTHAHTRTFVSSRLRGFAYPVGRADRFEAGSVRFVTAGIRGNVRLVLGMVRANRPWRLVASLSRALVAALGTSAFTLTSPGVWRIANGLSWARLIALSLGTIAGTCVLIIGVHGLWERSPNQAVREQVALFNAATALTLAFGISALYVALFLLNSLSGGALIAPSVLEAEIHHPISIHDYLWLAWLVSSLATIGGALGVAVESDSAVREAAYGFRGDDDTRR